jgi:multidrug transporter EmrE-like cation transporter
MFFSLGLVFLVVLLTGISHLLLKQGSDKRGWGEKENILAAYLNWHTLSAYSILFLSTILSIMALQVVPLKLFYAIAYSLSFVVVIGLSWSILNEEVTERMLIGIGLIIIGLLVFNV